MKKGLITLLLFVMLALCAVGFTACGGGDAPDNSGHTHSYTTTVVEPTCTEGGYVLHKCACGKEYKDKKSAPLGHLEGEPVKEYDGEVNCSEVRICNLITYCERCHIELMRDTFSEEPQGHIYSYSDAVIENEHAATCTENGSYESVVYCEVCHEEISRDYHTIYSTGHTYSYSDAVIENEHAATCTENGSYESVIYCEVCHEEIDRSYNTVWSQGHTSGDEVRENEQAPTCTELGSYDAVTYCSVCGVEMSRYNVTVSEKGHSAGDAVKENCVENATDSQAAGYDIVVRCTVCNEILSTETVSSSILTFTPNEGETEYSVTACSDKDCTIVYIPAQYNGKPVTSIGNEVFRNCYYLNEVEIPDTVTSIGDSAFYYTSLQTLTIPSSVQSIGASAFYYCYRLKTLTIPDSVTSLGRYAFRDCNNLETLTLGKNFPNLNDAFNSCSNLKSVYFTGTASEWANIEGISGLRNQFKTLYINGEPLTEIVLENVAVIQPFAFNYCKDLKTVTIGSGVTEISNYAFSYCTNLETVVVGGSVVNIDIEAFCGCSALTSVTIGDSVESISGSAFAECPQLTGITVSENNSALCSLGGIVYSKDKTSVIAVPQGISGVVTLPSTLTSLWSNAFLGCSEITGLVIENNAKFRSVNGIVYTLENGVATGIAVVPQGIVGDIVLPETLTRIRENAFFGCTALTGVTIGNNVTNIEVWAFRECPALKRITIGSGFIGENFTQIIYGCGGLAEIVIDANNPQLSSYYGVVYNKVQTYIVYVPLDISGDIELPYTLREIRSEFYGRESLTGVVLPVNLSSIGEDAFHGCSSLTSIDIPDSVESIGKYAFGYCSALESVTIGSGVKSIGMYAFSGCTSLKTLNIPDNVTSMGDFSGCTSLTSITFGSGITNIWLSNNLKNLESVTVSEDNPNYSTQNGILYNKDKTEIVFVPQSIRGAVILSDNLTSIEEGQFSSRKYITSVTIGDLVESIGRAAFEGCTNLTRVTIGQNVTDIGNDAFHNCYKLVEVYNKSQITITVDSWDNGDVGRYAKAVYSDESESKLATDANGFIIYDGTVLIAYSGVETDITVPSGITEIYAYAFFDYDCKGKLTSIVIPESVTAIGSSAFSGCSDLESVTIEGEIEGLESNLFYFCSSLTGLTIPNSVTYIEHGVFDYCSSLTQLNFNGTQDEWNAVSKVWGWRNGSGIEKVVCTDGIINQ